MGQMCSEYITRTHFEHNVYFTRRLIIDDKKSQNSIRFFLIVIRNSYQHQYNSLFIICWKKENQYTGAVDILATNHNVFHRHKSTFVR